MAKYKTILTTLVGSKAHGLDTKDSDTDVRGIFIVPTSEIVKLGGHISQTSWVEGEDKDATSYELAKFLFMAMKSNATVLEVLHGPAIVETELSKELKSLFPYMWSSKGVLEAFRGYSLNQRKKFLEDKDNRTWKYAVAYIRVLLLGIELLRNNTLTVNTKQQTQILQDLDVAWFYPDYPDTDKSASGADGYYYPSFDLALRDIKDGKWSKGQILDWAEFLVLELVKAYEFNPNHQNNPDKLNEFLLKVRKENW